MKFIISWIPIVAGVILFKLWFDWTIRIKGRKRNLKFFLKTWLITGLVVFVFNFGRNTIESAYSNYHGYVRGSCLESDVDENGEYCTKWQPVYVGIDKEFEIYLINSFKYGLLLGLFGAYGIYQMDKK